MESPAARAAGDCSPARPEQGFASQQAGAPGPHLGVARAYRCHWPQRRFGGHATKGAKGSAERGAERRPETAAPQGALGQSRASGGGPSARAHPGPLVARELRNASGCSPQVRSRAGSRPGRSSVPRGGCVPYPLGLRSRSGDGPAGRSRSPVRALGGHRPGHRPLPRRAGAGRRRRLALAAGLRRERSPVRRYQRPQLLRQQDRTGRPAVVLSRGQADGPPDGRYRHEVARGLFRQDRPLGSGRVPPPGTGSLE